MAIDFENGWSGLKSYALKIGVISPDDGDDAAAAKIKAVLRDTPPPEVEDEDDGETNTDY